MSLRDNYLKERLKKYSYSAISKKLYREQILAQRELETFSSLMAISNLSSYAPLKGKRVLDLGSGDQFLKKLLQAQGAIYTPIDYDIANFDTDRLPFSCNTFDTVFSLAVIEHIENTENFLMEAFRVLKPNGIIYLSTPNFRFCFKSFFDDPTHVKPFTDKSIKNILELFQFNNVATFPGARCKSDWFYKGKNRFLKCAFLPFREKRWYLPTFLCGRATSVIAIGQKPVS